MRALKRNSFVQLDRTPSTLQKQGRRILVVDDDDLVASTLELMLRSSGYDVTAVLSAMEAASLLQSQHFDLLITDFRMPVMTGLDLIHELRLMGNTIPVMILTGYFDQLEKEEHRLDDMDVREVLMKPVGLKAFLASIEAHLPKSAEN